jgi:hypothetical protein
MTALGISDTEATPPGWTHCKPRDESKLVISLENRKLEIILIGDKDICLVSVFAQTQPSIDTKAFFLWFTDGKRSIDFATLENLKIPCSGLEPFVITMVETCGAIILAYINNKLQVGVVVR